MEKKGVRGVKGWTCDCNEWVCVGGEVICMDFGEEEREREIADE